MRWRCTTTSSVCAARALRSHARTWSNLASPRALRAAVSSLSSCVARVPTTVASSQLSASLADARASSLFVLALRQPLRHCTNCELLRLQMRADRVSFVGAFTRKTCNELVPKTFCESGAIAYSSHTTLSRAHTHARGETKDALTCSSGSTSSASSSSEVLTSDTDSQSSE